MDNLNLEHHTPIQLRFNDIDTLGHVNNAVYQNYFDLGKVAYFTDVFGQPPDWNNQALVLASITIDYGLPVLFTEKVEVRTRVYYVGNKSLRMLQQLVNHDGEVKATARSVMVAFNYKAQTSFEIPVAWRKAILAHEKELDKSPA